MKAILEFELPEEKSDFDLAVQGADWYYVAFKLDEWLRGEMKHPSSDMSDDTYEALQKCRQKLRWFAHDNNLYIE